MNDEKAQLYLRIGILKCNLVCAAATYRYLQDIAMEHMCYHIQSITQGLEQGRASLSLSELTIKYVLNSQVVE